MNVAISTKFFPMAVNNIGNVVHCHLAAMNNKNGNERRRKSMEGKVKLSGTVFTLGGIGYNFWLSLGW